MSGRLISGLFASLLTLGIAAGVPARAAAQATASGDDARLGGVYVTTLPSAADVFFDGTYVGRSPLVVDGVAAGRHELTVTKAGYTTAETTLSIDAEIVATSNTRLASAPRASANENGTLAVRGLPPHATVKVDGALVGSPKDPLPLGIGLHRLEVAMPHGRISRSFTIWAGTATDVVLGEPQPHAHRSVVVALAEDYLPTDAFVIERTRIVIRYLGHVAVAHFGDSHVRMDGTILAFDAAPVSIGGKLYLPLEFLEKVTGDVSKSR